MSVLLVIVGAAVGAPTRYLTDRLIQLRFGSGFPLGTLTVNVVGSFVLGLLTGMAAGPRLTVLLGTGFCGALTTYSTLGIESVRLGGRGEHGRPRPLLQATAYVVVSILVGLGLACAGYHLGRS